jgi:tRNA threonylcarbamoyl adenosine modification protein YeaZ
VSVLGLTLLALDTATSRVVVARGGLDGAIAEHLEWAAGYRHGETLLPAIERILGPAGGRASIGAIVVGTGPGAFTGLRVGIATAKGLAHGLGCPIVGVSTGLALLAACADAESEADGEHEDVLLLPAGPSDRVLVRSSGAPELLPGGSEPSLHGGERVVAVDLDGRAPADAVARGGRARDGLAAALLRLGAARLVRDGSDDLERLVPDYVTLPRGVRATAGEVAWSRDPR